MLNIQKLKHSKLFYNEYPYKVECVQPESGRIVYMGVGRTREWCKRFPIKPGSKHANLSEFVEAVAPFINNKAVKIRTEQNQFNLFCKDIELLEEISNRLSAWIDKIVGPTTPEEYEFVMTNGNKKILCEHGLPKGKYKYRIYIKSSLPRENREKFLNWCEKFSILVNLSPSTVRWLAGKTYHVNSPFMYIYDEKVLTLVGMYLSGHIKRVEEFVVQ